MHQFILSIYLLPNLAAQTDIPQKSGNGEAGVMRHRLNCPLLLGGQVGP